MEENTPVQNLHRSSKHKLLIIVAVIAVVSIFLTAWGDKLGLPWLLSLDGKAPPAAAAGKKDVRKNFSKGRGRRASRNIAFAANVRVDGVDTKASTMDLLIEAGSFSVSTISLTDATIAVDPDAKIIVPGNPDATLADVADFERAYVFGRNVDEIYTITKIIVQK